MTASTDTARCLPIAALTGSGRAIMEDASLPVTGVAGGASPVVTNSAVVRASPATMTFAAARSAGELSPGTTSAPARLADRALQATTTSVAERKARDRSAMDRTSAEERRAGAPRVGSLTAVEDGAQVPATRAEDTGR